MIALMTAVALSCNSNATDIATFPVCPWLGDRVLPQGPSTPSVGPGSVSRDTKLRDLYAIPPLDTRWRPGVVYAVQGGMLLAAMVGGNHNHENDQDLDWAVYSTPTAVCRCMINAVPAMCPVEPNVYGSLGPSWWVPLPGSKDMGNVGNVNHYRSSGLIDFARTATGRHWFRGNLASARAFDIDNNDEVTPDELMLTLLRDTRFYMQAVSPCMMQNAARHINETIYWFKHIVTSAPYTPPYKFLAQYVPVVYTRPCNDDWTRGSQHLPLQHYQYP